MNKKVSIVIPVYKPNEKVLKKVREMIKKQTIKAELIETWNMPEAKSDNIGIRKSKGDIIITLSQDCIPENKYWLEKLIKPLEDKAIVISVSDLILPEYWWKEYPFLTRILTLKELSKRRSVMDARACAYRKKDLMKVGLFNEDPKVIGIDTDLYAKLRKLGKIVYPGCSIYHLHTLTNKKTIHLIYNYSEANGKIVRIYGKSAKNFWLRILRATPLIGLISIIGLFPYKKIKYWYLFLPFLIASLFEHSIWIYCFWKGFLFNKESIRNKEVLLERDYS
jgi:GT2 family glycosyltransferase